MMLEAIKNELWRIPFLLSSKQACQLDWHFQQWIHERTRMIKWWNTSGSCNVCLGFLSNPSLEDKGHSMMMQEWGQSKEINWRTRYKEAQDAACNNSIWIGQRSLKPSGCWISACHWDASFKPEARSTGQDYQQVQWSQGRNHSRCKLLFGCPQQHPAAAQHSKWQNKVMHLKSNSSLYVHHFKYSMISWLKSKKSSLFLFVE